jgi:hypothetical protein
MRWIASPEKDSGTETLERRLWDLTILLRRSTTNLRATRDLLLPRLMSGRLTLPEAEKAAAAAL